MRNTFDRFNGRHQDYQAARPSYAQEFLDWLGELYAPPERYTAADIGSGTGKLSAQLLAAGFRVCGVEPNPDMRGAAEALLGGDPRFSSSNGTDIPAEPVPYDGGQEAINALVGGHVDVAIGSPPTYRDYVINGELNCLGTFIPEGLEVEGIGHISSFRDQGVDVDFTGMDYFAVRSSVDDSKKEVLTNFIAEVYADPEFQEFMKGMGMEAWEATESEIVDMVEAQTEAMTEYIPLVQ